MAGEMMGQITALVKPQLEQEAPLEPLGKVLMGTVEGDIHDIGKEVVVFMLDANGFEVVDLGVDVAPADLCRQDPRNPAGRRRLERLC